MKILFVASQNAKTESRFSPIVKNQAKSIIENNVKVEFFGIEGKGIKSYYKNISKLKNHLKNNKYDIIHSHYGLCGIVSYFAHSSEKLVQSFMGSDIYGNFDGQSKSTLSGNITAQVNRIFKTRYDYCITKSERMKNLFKNTSNIEVIPNGVNLNDITILDKIEARKELGLDLNKKYVVFPAKREVKRKNIVLVEQAVNRLQDYNIEILAYDGIPFEKVNLYLNAGDVCMLPSFAEGSPNAIKEAMAASIPIVATDVGDVIDLITKTEGCYICDFTADDATTKLKKALAFGRRTTGREDIKHLDSNVVAKKIINIYDKVLKGENE